MEFVAMIFHTHTHTQKGVRYTVTFICNWFPVHHQSVFSTDNTQTKQADCVPFLHKLSSNR